MVVYVQLYKDTVTVVLSATYRPDLYCDYMTQASEMAMPFFMLGYHLQKAELKVRGE